MPIETDRFLIQKLAVSDVSDIYLSWLSDSTSGRWIVAADKTKRLDDLRMYVKEKSSHPGVLFLGIFDKLSGVHIGNIKYEPIAKEISSTVMGVLIGDPDYRGRGVFGEVYASTAAWLKANLQVRDIFLGVDAENTSAIRAYVKAGFVSVDIPEAYRKILGNVSMVHRLASEIPPFGHRQKTVLPQLYIER